MSLLGLRLTSWGTYFYAPRLLSRRIARENVEDGVSLHAVLVTRDGEKLAKAPVLRRCVRVIRKGCVPPT